MKRRICIACLFVAALGCVFVEANAQHDRARFALLMPTLGSLDTIATDSSGDQPSYRNAWGLDILVSNDGFGLGTFYRRQFSDDLFGFAMFSISEAKDEREFEQFDPFLPGVSYVPGKLMRFLVMPLTIGVQYRIFQDAIADNFRPFVNAGVGPTMIFAAPFVELVRTSSGTPLPSQVEFFKSLGKGQPHYTATAFIGIGANFGTEKANVLGANFRYYFTYLFGNGLPSLYNLNTGEIAGRKKDFGGFFITLNVGTAY